MKTVIALVMMVASSAAFAKWAPIVDTTTLTCADAKARVTRNGFQHYKVAGKPADTKVVRYFTFWADRNPNSDGDKAITAFVPTLDKAKCFIGFRYVSKDDYTGNLSF